MKHTPGPWRTEDLFVYPTDETKTAVADCGRTIYNIEQGRANAKLIAAAPELLEMLKAAKEHLEYCGYGDSYERECAGNLDDRIQNAIDKATKE